MMKKILLTLFILLTTANSFSQMKMNIWDKNPKTGKTTTKINPSKLPNSFESTLPDGTTEIYDKWNLPPIKIESSKGKKYTIKLNAYKSRGGFNYVNYTENGWEGKFFSKKEEKMYSMSPESSVLDTLRDLNVPDLKCGSGAQLPIPANMIEKKVGETKKIQQTPPIGLSLTKNDYYNKNIPINKTVTVYAEVSFELHQHIGSNIFPAGVSLTKTQNWVTNLFLGVSQIYANEGLTVVLNKIYVWETDDPYDYGADISTTETLYKFYNNIYLNIPTNPQSIVKHFLYRSSGLAKGGVAFVNGSSNGFDLNTNQSDTKIGVSDMNGLSYFLPTPPTNLTNYIGSVSIVAHELGHNFGSQHTQWCGWKNDVGTQIGRLDSCYAAEPAGGSPANCNSSTKNTTIPTIMSYCHLTSFFNTMLTNGFGKYPRFSIRNTINTQTYIPFNNITLPTVTTSSVTSITPSSASGGGNVTSNGGGNLLSRGVCWAVSPTVPTISNSLTNDGTLTGTFTSSITGLTASTTYNVRAYVTNSAGTSYGSTVSFTTSAATIPTLSTVAASSITQTTATSGGTITSNGGSNITAKGVCWSTSPNPTIALTTKTSDGTGSTNFISNITGLVAGTTYFLRAYAQNGVGVGYGNEITFTSSPISTPTLTTTSITTFTNTTATMGGNITSNGGGNVTRRGVCYATTQNPDTTRTVVNIGSGTGTFSQSVTGLSQRQLYYVRAFAINSAGISYGTQQSFTTAGPPTVTTTSATNITVNSAQSGGNVTNNNGSTVTSRGICFAQTQNPTTSNTVISGGTGNGSFTSQITGLNQGVLYYVRAFATNSYGTSYGSQISFRTLNVPTVTTTSATAIAKTSFTTGGNVTSAGGGALTVTERGVVWSNTVLDPTTSDTKVIATTPTGTGSYTINLSGLTAGTVYYVRAYAVNSIGTAYGSRITVTTPNEPVLTTTTITSVTTNSAVSGGTISSSTGSSVTARGVCYAITPNPTTANSTTSNGTGTGTFTSNITGLTPSTLYYVRAYATNTTGTGYGNQLTFTTTASGSVPTLTTSAVTSITQTTAISGGNITSDGGFAVTTRGVCWSTSPDPTIANSVVNSGSGTGTFSSSITGLSPNTTYFVRAFATNSNGTNYGGQVSFTTTSSITIPTVTTNVTSSITSTSAQSGGNVTLDGGASVTARGVCYATTPNPSISNTVINSGTGTGSFSTPITGLLVGTTYFVRAFATNSAGTNYGSEQTFTTLNFPTVSTTAASSISITSATTGGNVTSDGGASVTARGVCFATTSNPTLSNSFTSDGTGTGTFTSNLGGLVQNTTYFVRAYATNSVGTSYGNQISFTTTTGATLPTVTTTSLSNITSTTARSGGNITSSGSQSVTQRGVVWSTSSNPEISLATKTQNGTGTGTFVSDLTSLLPSTTYYVRAYATSSVGTGYGNEIQFNTSSTTTTNCSVDSLFAYKSGGFWRFKWRINPTCLSYTVNLTRWKITNPSTPPPVGHSDWAATGNRLTNYVPTVSEVSQGLIDQQMNPQPQSTNFWYSVDVKCNNNTVCTPSPLLPNVGLGNTRYYFFVSP